jgi:HSP20 family protein
VELKSEKGSKHKSNYVISSHYRQWTTRAYVWQPPTDVYETGEKYVVRMEIAGMHASEFTITLEGHTLVIQGTRGAHAEQCAYHQVEIRSGEFVSVVELPGAVDGEHVEAEYEDGFLQVILPKSTPRRVDVDD